MHRLTVAQSGFEAARQLGPLQGWMGHGFTAQVAAPLPAGWAPYAGGEVPALAERLTTAVAPLHHSLLNEVLSEPDDLALAHWIAQALQPPLPGRISVQRHAHQGVHLSTRADGSARSRYWRRYRFQSAHRLPHVPIGHKCGRMHGHSFEAMVEASQPAEHIDEAWAPLHMQLNYRCLNELPGLANPTSEILASWLWQRLSADLPGLTGVTVYETASCGAHVGGGDHHRIWKDFSFDSASSLRHAPSGSPRSGLHGHTYTLRLHLQAPLDPELGWAVDFGEVKDRFKPLFEALDHHDLGQIDGLADGDCASIAAWVMQRGRRVLPQLNRVDVFEAPGCGSILSSDPHEVPVLPESTR